MEKKPYIREITYVDGPAFLLAAVGFAARSSTLVLAGCPGTLLSGPLLHLVHGHGEHALASFGLRTLAVFCLSFAGWIIRQPKDDPEDPDYGRLVGVMGMGIAVGGWFTDRVMAVDISYPKQQAPSLAIVGASPWFTHRGGGFGISAVF